MKDKIFKAHFDDYLAPAADVFITAIHYTRINESTAKWAVLSAKLGYLKKKV